MDEYIKREELIESILNGSGTSTQKMFAECCVYAVPTAEVVPREEVDRLRHILNSYALQYGTVKDQQAVIDRIKQENAMEIFEEISAIIQRNTELALRNGRLRISGYNGKQIARLIYELKEKYTEDSLDGKRTDC